VSKQSQANNSTVAADSDSLKGRRGLSGTSAMLIGTAATIVGSYVFLLVGGRALGEDAFAPVTVMWTLLFLGLTVFLIPIEQLIIRKLALGGGRASAVRASWKVIGVVVFGATFLAVGFTFAAQSSLLNDDLGFVPVAALLLPLHAFMLIGRGFLAGRGRFVAYGAVVGLDAFGKAAGAVIVAVLGLGPVALVWALALSPVLVLVVRPFRADSGGEVGEVLSPPLLRSDRRFMSGFLVATAASQTVLAAGPLVVGALGASSAAISVFFVTTTLFRGPMSASYNLLARFLPGLTRRAAAGEHETINRFTLNFAVAGMLGAGISAAAAAMAGPPVVALLYGSGFRPTATLAALAAAGVIVGIVGLGITQVLVGRGETDRMAAAWLVAVVAAAITIVVVQSDPTIRVAAGFFCGEVVALIGLTASTMIKPGRHLAGSGTGIAL
jgi:O-antigen/teichoic acid export membrane protein